MSYQPKLSGTTDNVCASCGTRMAVREGPEPVYGGAAPRYVCPNCSPELV